MAWADKERQERVMWATQTQQVLHTVLEASELFFMFPMMSLSFHLVFGVWFGFFKFDLSSWNFSFLSPKYTFPPSSMPLCWVCAEVLLWHAYCREKGLKQESPAAAPGAAMPTYHDSCALGCGTGCALGAQCVLKRLEQAVLGC